MYRLIAALLLVATPAVAAPRPSPEDAFLADLPATLAAAKEVHAVAVGAPSKIKATETEQSDHSKTLDLAVPARDAAWFVRTWKLARPYAVAIDVHQHSWIVELFGQKVDDPYNDRIALVPITYGGWTVRLRLAGRPAGSLPKLVAGASPAYDLTHYQAQVVGITIERAAP